MELTSGYPFWPVRDGLIRAYPALDQDATCDVAIIGGGITGAIIAYHLVEAGFDTLVLDKRDVGWGSTSASTALLQYEIDVSLADLTKLLGSDHASRAYLACREAIDKLEKLASRLSEPCGFERKKSLYLATKRRDKKALRKELALRRALGLHVEWLDESDIAERFPFRRPAALLSDDGAQVDAYAFTHALMHDASIKGLRVFDRTTVKAVNAKLDGVKIRTVDGFVVSSRHVVFATGYETHEFLKQKLARLISTYALASEPISLDAWGEDQCIIWEHADPYLYLRTTSDSRIIVGGEDEPFRNPELRDRLISRKTKRLVKRLGKLFPAIDIKVAFSWAGTFAETKDGLAYIGAHDDWPSAHFALCYGGNGITYSVLAAEIIRDSLLDRRNDNARLFRFDR